MYSVLTRELWRDLCGDRITMWIVAMGGGVISLCAMGIWVTRDQGYHLDAAKANALTYEDGLALANSYRGLLKEAKEPDSEIEAMLEICRRESSFDPKMQNPASTSHGLFGFLDSTCKKYGGCGGDPERQTKMAWRYVWDRYGSAKSALDFHKKHGWY